MISYRVLLREIAVLYSLHLCTLYHFRAFILERDLIILLSAPET